MKRMVKVSNTFFWDLPLTDNKIEQKEQRFTEKEIVKWNNY